MQQLSLLCTELYTMKNVIITGATKGMGKAIAQAFAAEGCNLAICSRNETELKAFKLALEATYPTIKVAVLKADCSIKQDVKDFAAFAEAKLGTIYVIVNNIGIYQPTSILDDGEDTFENLLNTNLRPAYELYRYFGKKMQAQRAGHIFNICSIASISPVVQAGMYSVTKFALLGLNKVMRLEMQDHGVKVTTVLPGSTFTDSWKGSDLPAEKFVSAQDVAQAVICAFKMSAGANLDELVVTPQAGPL